jgi:hypothetical protein
MQHREIRRGVHFVVQPQRTVVFKRGVSRRRKRKVLVKILQVFLCPGTEVVQRSGDHAVKFDPSE